MNLLFLVAHAGGYEFPRFNLPDSLAYGADESNERAN